jgi:WD40 repeat protein
VATYDAFISYSHAGDGRLAPRLQSGLQRFARPWWKRRLLRVFRDQTGLSASPHLWTSITAALDDSEWFILLASPESAASEWVGREIQHWHTHHDTARMLLVITDGTFAWDEASGDIDFGRSTAAHQALAGVFDAEPRHIDLGWARDDVHIDRRDGRFQDALAELAAPLRGLPKDEIAGEDVRQHRRTIRLARSAVAGLVGLTALSLVAGILAVDQRNEARDQRTEAETQRNEADDQRIEAEAQRNAAEEQRQRADAEARVATARGAAANAAAQAGTNVERSLLLAAAAIDVDRSDQTLAGLVGSLDAVSGLVGSHPEAAGLTSADLDPRGGRLATVDVSGHVRIWSYPEMAVLGEALLPDGAKPYYLEYADSGAALVVGAETGLVILDSDELASSSATAADRPFTPTVPFEDALVLGAIDPSGSLIAIGQAFSPIVEIVDRATREVVISIDAGPRCFSGARGFDLDTETNLIAIVCETTIVLADLTTGAARWQTDSFGANDAQISPDGTVLAVGYITDRVDLYTIESGELFQTIDTPGTRVYALKWDDTGELLAVGTDGGDGAVYALLRAIDPAREALIEAQIEEGGFDSLSDDPTAFGPLPPWGSAKLVFDFRGMEGGVLSVMFVPVTATADPFTGLPLRSLVAGGPMGITEWDPQLHSAFAISRSVPDQIGYSARDLDREELYFGSFRDPGEQPGDAGETTFEVVSFDGAERRTLTLDSGAAQILELRDGIIVATGNGTWPASDPGQTGLITPTSYEVQLVDAVTGDVLRVIELADVYDLSPSEFMAEQWDLDPGFFLDDPRSIPFPQAWLSPDGEKLLLRVDERSVVWNLADGTMIAESDTAPFGRATAWSADSKYIVDGGFFGVVEVYAAADLELAGSLDLSPGYTISHVRSTAEPDVVLVTSEEGFVMQLTLPSLEPVGSRFTASGVQLQHSATSDDGSIVASVDRNGQLWSWRVADGSPIGPPFAVAGSDSIASLRVDFVGLDPVVEVGGTSVTTFSLDPDVLVSRVCELAGRELTAEEWTVYVGDRAQIPCGGSAPAEPPS